jgi:ABC-type transporter Mla subunit MlaD
MEAGMTPETIVNSPEWLAFLDEIEQTVNASLKRIDATIATFPDPSEVGTDLQNPSKTGQALEQFAEHLSVCQRATENVLEQTSQAIRSLGEPEQAFRDWLAQLALLREQCQKK